MLKYVSQVWFDAGYILVTVFAQSLDQAEATLTEAYPHAQFTITSQDF